jgi:hypothetical protein
MIDHGHGIVFTLEEDGRVAGTLILDFHFQVLAFNENGHCARGFGVQIIRGLQAINNSGWQGIYEAKE